MCVVLFPGCDYVRGGGVDSFEVWRVGVCRISIAFNKDASMVGGDAVVGEPWGGAVTEYACCRAALRHLVCMFVVAPLHETPPLTPSCLCNECHACLAALFFHSIFVSSFHLVLWRRYYMGGKDLPLITRQTIQDLRNVSMGQRDGRTVMQFTRDLDPSKSRSGGHSRRRRRALVEENRPIIKRGQTPVLYVVHTRAALGLAVLVCRSTLVTRVCCCCACDRVTCPMRVALRLRVCG